MSHSQNASKRDAQSEAPEEFSLADLMGILLANRRELAIITFTVFLLFFIYAFTAAPVYTANALLQVETQKKGFPGLEGVTEMLGEDSSSSAEIEIIRSRSVLLPVVEQLKLQFDIEPRYFPLFGEAVARRHKDEGLADALLGLSGYAWGGEILDIGRMEFSGPLQNTPSEWSMAVTENGYQLQDSDGVVVLEGKVGQLAEANHAGSHIQLFVTRLEGRPGVVFDIGYLPAFEAISELAKELKVNEKGKNTNIISISLTGHDRQEITAILDTIATNYVRSNVEQKSKEAGVLLEFIANQLPKLKENLDEAEARLQQYQQEVGTVDLSFEAQKAVTALADVEREISQLELKQTSLRKKFTDIHPTLIVVNDQIEQLKEMRKEQEAMLTQLPETEWETIQKKRDVQVANELYLIMLNKQQELKLLKEGTVGNVRIVDNAMSPFRPIKPQKLLLLGLGLVLGLFIGILYIFMRRVLSQGVEDSEQIENETGLAVFATIPHSDLQEKIAGTLRRKRKVGRNQTGIIAFQETDGLVVEAFRSLRTSLQFANRNNVNNIITISGPAPSIGKSFVSINLGAVISETGKRVLVIDADMRKGHLHKFVDTAQSPGLSEVINNPDLMEKSIHRINENLFFLSTGKRPPNPSELLMSDGFGSMLGSLKENYDQIIIDTPPILAVTDASIVATYSSQVFLLLRFGKHPMREIKAAMSRFEKDGVNITGVIMNDVTITNRGYSYNYHYSYT